MLLFYELISSCFQLRVEAKSLEKETEANSFKNCRILQKHHSKQSCAQNYHDPEMQSHVWEHEEKSNQCDEQKRASVDRPFEKVLDIEQFFE